MKFLLVTQLLISIGGYNAEQCQYRAPQSELPTQMFYTYVAAGDKCPRVIKL